MRKGQRPSRHYRTSIYRKKFIVNPYIMKKHKNKSYKQLRSKFNIHPLADDDRDRVRNYEDCRPWNRDRQDEEEEDNEQEYDYEKLSPERKKEADAYWKEREPTEEENNRFNEMIHQENNLHDGLSDLETQKRILERTKQEFIEAYRDYHKIKRKRLEDQGYDMENTFFKYESPIPEIKEITDDIDV